MTAIPSMWDYLAPRYSRRYDNESDSYSVFENDTMNRVRDTSSLERAYENAFSKDTLGRLSLGTTGAPLGVPGEVGWDYQNGLGTRTGYGFADLGPQYRDIAMRYGVTDADFGYDDSLGNYMLWNDRTRGFRSELDEIFKKPDALDSILTRGPMILGGLATGAALGGMFPGVDSLGNAIPAGQSGILSQWGLSNPGGVLEGGGGADTLTGGTASDGLPGTEKLFGDFYNAYASGAMTPAQAAAAGVTPDAIEIMDQALRATGASTATEAAKALGYSSFTHMLGSINPALVTAGSTAGSAVGRFLSGAATADDYAKLAGTIGAAGLGVLGANQQAGALNDVADKYLQLGAPFRGKLLESYSPGFSMMNEPGFKDAMDVSTKSVLSGLSAQVGNPYDNPGAVQEAQKYIMGNVALPQLNTYRSQLGTFGALGTNTAGTADMGSAGASGGMYDALGYGLSQLTGNDTSLEGILKKYPGLLGSNYRLTTGWGQ